MGTRNLTCVIKGGEWKVAQYGQFDGYPNGQGATVRSFLKNCDLDLFKKKIDLCWFGTNAEIEAAFKPFMLTNTFGLNIEEAENFKKSPFGHLSRDVAATILNVIYESSTPIMLEDSHDFGGEASCEWAYVIDLDQMVLEVYTSWGDGESKPGDRFYGLGGFPVHLVRKYPLGKIPSQKRFEKECIPPDED